MKIAILSLLLIVSTSSIAQLVPSSCSAPDSIIARYKEDATLLALRRIYDNNNPYKDSVNIPEQYIDTILDAMIAVYNATSIPERDSVIEGWDIHPLFNRGLHMFTVNADSSYAWMDQLQLGNASAGFAPLDAIITQNDFTQNAYYDWPWWYHTVIFGTTNTINIEASIQPLALSSEVYSVTSDHNEFDGSNIISFVHPDHVELRYLHRFGDCPSGCIYQHTWIFNVYYDCSVELVASYDGPALGIADNNIQSDPIMVSPNPFSTYITINGMEGNYSYQVVDNLGKVVASNNRATDQSIDLSSLPTGSYILLLEQEDKLVQKQLIKL